MAKAKKSIKNKLVHYANRQVTLAKEMAVLQQERAQLEFTIDNSKANTPTHTKASKRLAVCKREYEAAKKEFNKIQKQVERM